MENEYRLRTDLAVEAKEMFVEKNPEKEHELDGIIIREFQADDVKLTRVEIDEEGSKRVGKSPGEYVTLESQKLRELKSDFMNQISTMMAKELSRLIQKHEIPNDARCLIVGLGNEYITPDALGPRTVNKTYVNAHLFKLHPDSVEKGVRPIAAFTPGVMGMTGIETSDMIFGVTKQSKPDFIIVIDALAARSINRVNATIQMSDTGIHPGSGVGNNRKEVSEATLNVPVFSIGVPTVVDAVTITSDTIDYMLKHFGREISEQGRASKALTPAGMSFGKRKLLKPEDLPDEETRKKFMGVIGALGEEEKRQLIQEVLHPIGHNLMVTPKEVDEVIEELSMVIANGLNQGLHASIDEQNANDYL
ncbi:GPR endopeptidase [Allobacillus sp. GCM10007491]|uniref:Germination protease n=1 Tax=Allobacillus saliphilus TaxID=2912308 RepID=A0A941HTJ3_9BACI|nr:GPR endopeptidase [Allobacillus saliphilus]MBR7553344.1 GPR endopeptidase [Allobacillus saliphilus]